MASRYTPRYTLRLCPAFNGPTKALNLRPMSLYCLLLAYCHYCHAHASTRLRVLSRYYTYQQVFFIANRGVAEDVPERYSE
jgi:hypothetical protein